MLQHTARVGFIGAGNITQSLIAGLLHAKLVLPSHLIASDIDPAARDAVSGTYHVATTAGNSEAAEGADVLVLAVEPQVLDHVLTEIADIVQEKTLIVSVAAGYPIARIARHLRGVKRKKIVRAMPNTPAAIREGVTAIACDDDVPADELATARSLFESIGHVVTVPERLLDAVTGLSGSGPAYVYIMTEALADGGVKMGLPRHTAQLLAAQTVVGAARLLLASGEHPGVLKDRVASPGGTTIAGIHALELGRFRATVTSAVEAAAKRSAELGFENQ
ncbi:MAG: pyrroline-5-carboxylate reductase [Nitrospira sp.]|nr:pyrroline-5-carboxylate reductase [Nitrospira sp.]